MKYVSVFVLLFAETIGNCQTSSAQQTGKQPVPPPAPPGATLFSDTPPCDPPTELPLTSGLAVLRNGNSIKYERRQRVGSTTRLYISGDFCLNVLTAEIAHLRENDVSERANVNHKATHKDIAAIAREANGAIVSIIMADKDGHPIAQGSGFLISKDGDVVTNYHVIRNGSTALVKLPNGTFFAVDGVLAYDKSRDVAIIKAHGVDFRTLTLGDSDRLQVGEEVVAIGNLLSLESTVSNGIVSAIRTVDEGKFVQITAPISPGSSGGPLFNMSGEVVGITTSHLVGGQNLNFAIPINDEKLLLGAKFVQVRAFPEEPEVAAVMHGATARTDNSDLPLEETQQWMKDNIVGVGAWSNQAVTWFVDGGQVVEPSSGYFLCTLGCVPLYAVTLSSAVNVRNGTPHDWQRYTKEYDLKFDGCSMTVDDFDSVSSSTGTIPDTDAHEKVRFNGSQTFDLHQYDSSVITLEDAAAQNNFDLKTGRIVVAKGTKYVNDVAWVTAKSLSHYNGWPIHIYLSYPFAERFAKALKHAISLCGGQPESF